MIIDLHIHTMVSSPCSEIDPVQCIETAITRGLDAICVTEHGTIEGGLVAKQTAESYPGIVVLAGMEVQSRESHLLVYGYMQDIRGTLPARDIIDMVEAEGGIVIPAHPWRKPFGWYSGTIDRPLEDTEFPELFRVIEKCSGSSNPKQNEQAESYCIMTGSTGIGGSDAHSLREIGMCVTEFEDRIEDERQLVAAIRSGRFKSSLLDSYFSYWGE